MKQIRRTLFVLLCGVATGSAGMALLQPPPTVSRAESVELTAAEAALEKRLPEVSLVNVPLDEALMQLSALAGVPIGVDEPTLQAAGVSLKTPVTVRVRNLPLNDILTQICSDLNRPYGLTVGVLPDRMVLTTENAAANPRFCFVRVYDVGDLADVEVPSVEPPILCFGGSGATAQGGPAASATTTKPVTPSDRAFHFAQVIRETIAPDGWRENGGAIGSIQVLRSQLVVTQSGQNHLALRRLLADLRKPQTAAPKSATLLPSAESQRWNQELSRWVSDSPDATEAKMRLVIDNFAVENKPVTQAIRALCAKADIPVVFHKSYGDADRAWIEATTSAKYRNSVFFDVLRGVMNNAQDGRKNEEGEEGLPLYVPLGWWLDGEVLVVGPRDQLGGMQVVTRVYDVRDLSAAVEQMLPTAKSQAAPVGQNLTGAERIQDTIVHMIDEPGWLQAGGSTGSARVLGGMLTITQTRENHDNIERLLQEFRAKGLPAKLPAKPDQ